VEQAGYADQPHLTRSLRRFIGETPAQIMRQARPDHVVFVQDGAPQGALSWAY
jgi:AraC-like DNA-binding protein